MASPTGFNIEQLQWIVNILGILFGFIASLMIKGLLDDLKSLKSQVASHREDVLKNYPSNSDLLSMKDDIMDRLDKAEHNIKNSVQASMFRSQIAHLKEGGQQ
jgi:hypothetical protein